jgi:hypothetical protein
VPAATATACVVLADIAGDFVDGDDHAQQGCAAAGEHPEEDRNSAAPRGGVPLHESMARAQDEERQTRGDRLGESREGCVDETAQSSLRAEYLTYAAAPYRASAPTPRAQEQSMT